MLMQQCTNQPLSVLSFYSSTLERLIEESVNQIKTLRLADHKMLDIEEATLFNLFCFYQEQLSEHWKFNEQFKYWQDHENLTNKEETELKQLFRMAAKLKRTNQEVLTLVRRLLYIEKKEPNFGSKLCELSQYSK